jgi:hypothetical protein
MLLCDEVQAHPILICFRFFSRALLNTETRLMLVHLFVPRLQIGA